MVHAVCGSSPQESVRLAGLSGLIIVSCMCEKLLQGEQVTLATSSSGKSGAGNGRPAETARAHLRPSREIERGCVEGVGGWVEDVKWQVLTHVTHRQIENWRQAKRESEALCRANVPFAWDPEDKQVRKLIPLVGPEVLQLHYKSPETPGGLRSGCPKSRWSALPAYFKEGGRARLRTCTWALIALPWAEKADHLRTNLPPLRSILFYFEAKHNTF